MFHGIHVGLAWPLSSSLPFWACLLADYCSRQQSPRCAIARFIFACAYPLPLSASGHTRSTLERWRPAQRCIWQSVPCAAGRNRRAQAPLGAGGLRCTPPPALRFRCICVRSSGTPAKRRPARPRLAKVRTRSSYAAPHIIGRCSRRRADRPEPHSDCKRAGTRELLATQWGPTVALASKEKQASKL